MNTRTGSINDQDDLTAALRRYPACSLQIQQLYVGDETFRELCSDLVAAERAIKTMEELPDPIRTERRAEFAEMANRLAGEIEKAISQRGVVPLRL
ncbi:hypothetical protein [Phyllobacterium zundukense]|uniref:Uncharacterized protein n=1 Tax=Phyllobacterium zundukense TaxID=1867719 RepID=A0A2N9VT91_9HYPH|nr:hypothetical protein [Phyllobacterium zundukense]ATU93341.1 hypothetical protein BLM14_18325 [Phyllobacterium zundukense]PIO42709.1 hypothetical protein B5P45_19760 [Phyllobacterium zundukense]